MCILSFESTTNAVDAEPAEADRRDPKADLGEGMNNVSGEKFPSGSTPPTVDKLKSAH